MDINPIKKILIFGLPRTKTTALQLRLARLFGLTSLNEPYANHHGVCVDQDPHEWTQKQNNCVIKLLTTNLVNRTDLSLTKLLVMPWDRLVVTNRFSHTDAAVSLYYAEQISGRYHYQDISQINTCRFRLDLDWIKRFWLPELEVWHKSIAHIKSLHMDHDVIQYENYIPTRDQTVAGRTFRPYDIDSVSTNSSSPIDSSLNYSDLCENYNEVQYLVEKFKKELC